MILNKIIVGDSYSVDLSDYNSYLSQGYTLNLSLRGLSELDIATTTTSLAITSAQSSTLSPATHSYLLYATKTTERITLQQGTVLVIANPLDSAVKDFSSFNIKMLDALEAHLLSKADSNQLDHLKSVIGDKELQRMSLTDLVALRNKFLNLVNQEQGKSIKRVNYFFQG